VRFLMKLALCAVAVTACAPPLAAGSILSGQHFPRDIGTAGQLGVVGQEQTAAVFRGHRQVERLHQLETMRRPNAGSPFADRRRQGQHLDVRIAEERPVTRFHHGIAGQKRPDQAFRSRRARDD
jgi:hypothetical protein